MQSMRNSAGAKQKRRAATEARAAFWFGLSCL